MTDVTERQSETTADQAPEAAAPIEATATIETTMGAGEDGPETANVPLTPRRAPEPESRILHGLTALRRDNPWPDFCYGEIAPFFLPLDGGRRAGVEVGGGREILIDLIRRRNIELMVEIGCFLCGSTLQWLRSCEKLTIIGVDHWGENWAALIERMSVDPHHLRTFFHLTEAEVGQIVTNLRRHGNFAIAMNNVRLYKQRFIPVRRTTPGIFPYLAERKIEPQLIYIDAAKQRRDLDAAHMYFPNSILCGDDWLWPDETGVMRMQEAVKEFAAEKGFDIQAEKQTWILSPRRR